MIFAVQEFWGFLLSLNASCHIFSPKASPRCLLADLLHERRVCVGGGLLGELAGGEGALQGVVLVLDLLQLEVLPLFRVRTRSKPVTPGR